MSYAVIRCKASEPDQAHFHIERRSARSRTPRSRLMRGTRWEMLRISNLFARGRACAAFSGSHRLPPIGSPLKEGRCAYFDVRVARFYTVQNTDRSVANQPRRGRWTVVAASGMVTRNRPLNRELAAI